MVKRIRHVGIVVEDVEVATKFWSDALGLKKFDDLEIAVEGVRSVFLSVGGTPDEMAIELIEPIDKSDMSNAIARRLANSGAGFYHLAVEVEDVQASSACLIDRGLTIIERPPAGEQDERRWLVHPKDANGVMVEGLQGS